MAVIAGQLAEKIVIEGDDSARSKLSMFGRACDDAQRAMTSKLVGGAKQAGAGFLDFAGSIRAVAIPAVIALGGTLVGIGAAIASTIPKAGSFEETMNLIGISNNLAAQQVEDLTRSVLKMGPAVGKGPQDLADGLYYVMGAGFQAGQAMDILKRSAQQASVGMTQTEVVANAATAALKAFPALSTAHAFDVMTKAVFTGKTEWDTFGPAIGKVSLFAQQAGSSFEEANTALSVLTNTMPSTEQASTSLISLLQTSSRFTELAKRARDLGIAFDVNAYKNLNFIEKLRYLQQATKGSSEAMYQLLGQEEAMPAIQALLTDGAKDYSKALQEITNSAGVADMAWQRSSEGLNASWRRVTSSVEALQVKVGMALIPVMKLFVNNIAPVLQNIVDWIDSNHVLEGSIQTIGNFISGTVVPGMQQLQPIVAYLAPIFDQLGTSVQNLVTAATPVVVGFARWADESGALRLYISALAAEVGIFVQGLSWLAQGIANVITFFSTGGSNAKWLWDILAGIGAFLVATFKPVWDQLVATFQTQLVPAWDNLIRALGPAMPLFQEIGLLIGGVLVIAIGVLVGAIGGIVRAIGGLLVGVVQVFGGIVQVISGALQIILGIIGFFVDLFTGKWDKLGQDLINIGTGIATFFVGLWNIIVGIFRGAWGVISGLFDGFFQSIVGFFANLYNALVGHSIVPDIVNGIMHWFSMLPEFLAGIGRGMWDGIKAGINLIINGLNNFIGYLNDLTISTPQISLPGVEIPAASIGLPYIPPIPRLARGGLVGEAGYADIGERGMERVYLPRGARVVPHSQLVQNQQAVAPRGLSTIIIELNGRAVGRALLPEFADQIRYGAAIRSI